MQPIAGLGWRVVVEQPTSEAFALAVRLERFLVLTIGLALLATLAIASLWGRTFLRPITALMRGTRALAAGRFGERVADRGTRRVRAAGRRLQPDGRSPGDAAGRGGQAGAPGHVRTHRRRPRPRHRASGAEHRQQLQADAQDVRRPGHPRAVPPHGRSRVPHARSVCSRICATWVGRFRSSAFRSTSTAR